MQQHHIIVGITGASGAIYGITLLKALQELNISTHLIISKTARITIPLETNYSVEELSQFATKTHSPADMAACISSGSFKTSGMIIAPCSMRSMAEIAGGVTSSLITRAADVVLKEQRKLVLMVRETPMHAGHLENALKLARMGAVIAPPVPAFYNNPETLQDIVDHSVGRVLDLFDIDTSLPKRWKSDAMSE